MWSTLHCTSGELTSPEFSESAWPILDNLFLPLTSTLRAHGLKLLGAWGHKERNERSCFFLRIDLGFLPFLIPLFLLSLFGVTLAHRRHCMGTVAVFTLDGQKKQKKEIKSNKFTQSLCSTSGRILLTFLLHPPLQQLATKSTVIGGKR